MLVEHYLIRFYCFGGNHIGVSKVSLKGSVVIPLEIRKKFGIEAGMKVNIISINNSIRIVPIPTDPIKSLRGSVKFGKTAIEIKQEMRSEELECENRKWNRPSR